jgi:hypothetical protein
MVELDEATRRALLAREGPPASARAEVLAGLRTRLSGPGGPEDPSEPELGGGESLPLDAGVAASSPIAWAAKLVGTTLGLAAAGVLTIKIAAVTVVSLREQPAAALAEAQLEKPERSPVLEAPPAIDEITPLEHAPAPTPSVDARSREAVAAASEAVAPESTLAAELVLVRAAKQLRDDDPAAALAKLDLHGQHFPAGSLAPEREAMRVELLCTLGRSAAAAKLREQFLAQHGDSPLRARVLVSCEKAGTDPTRVGD